MTTDNIREPALSAAIAEVCNSAGSAPQWRYPAGRVPTLPVREDDLPQDRIFEPATPDAVELVLFIALSCWVLLTMLGGWIKGLLPKTRTGQLALGLGVSLPAAVIASASLAHLWARWVA